MEPYTSRHAGVVWAIRAITTLESIRSKRAKQSSGGVDLSSHICEGWLPRSQSSGVLTLRCRYLSHPRERSESIGYAFPVFIKLPPRSLSPCDTCGKTASSLKLNRSPSHAKSYITLNPPPDSLSKLTTSTDR